MEIERDGTKRGRWRGGERGQDGEREMGRGGDIDKEKNNVADLVLSEIL